MSSPDPARRPVTAVELKQGKPLRDTLGWQGRHLDLGVGELVAHGVVAPDAPRRALYGDAREVLARLGAEPG